jgi:hypothetical protein
LAFLIAFLIGIGFMLAAFGLSFFTVGFWTHNDVASPVLPYVLMMFGIFAVAGFIPSIWWLYSTD